ncbi:hypothetical protein AVEN_205236-1 [Araneus ventricosus]|uniref:Uncharacterized protein n=1 Tax=Araneus ventricosus TaxID=182803 RepID=A0A4Y2IFJ3_ARAVE|nr:hypothetical protein AVEN_205236-1 [Araneus ventricosus]
MLVLWLGREFYRGKYGMPRSGQNWTPDLGDKFGDFDYSRKCAYFLYICITSRVPDFSKDFHVTSSPVRNTIGKVFLCRVTLTSRVVGVRTPLNKYFGVSSAVRHGEVCDACPPPTADTDLRPGVCVLRALVTLRFNGHLPLPSMPTVSSSTWNPHPSIDGLLPFITELWGVVQNFHLPIARN